ncbi:hypothetical protein SRB5_39740 [Streptomyces sp. RB5]|uniref:Uncharacterized protein n=1 Tax=Streptomyces smaragdinus TaxID=2585196 RepID=A0A7K0CK12_9ACTN|nr:hypothetical protein [Streptomyces smaragdinus]MQY13818.1 hypothetical protein [Streptomyces smaragdinus]
MLDHPNPASRPPSAPPRVTHVTPLRRDAVFDGRAEQAALQVVVHDDGGGSSETVMVFTVAQLEQSYAQFARLLAARDAVRGE